MRTMSFRFIKPEKADMMKRPVEKTKGLGADEQKALADFLLRYGN